MPRRGGPESSLGFVLVCLSHCRARGKGDDSISVLTYNLFLGANINAHLDLNSKVKRSQAAELLKLARSSPLPTILAGDFNIGLPRQQAIGRKSVLLP